MAKFTHRAVLSIALCLPAAAQYSVSSANGPYAIPSGSPTSTGGGVWAIYFSGANTTSIPLATPVPTTAGNVKRIVLNSLSHTASGDLHFVLCAPSGARYTLVHRPNFMNTDTYKGQVCDYLGAYTIVDPATPGALSWPANSSACAGTAHLPPGQYAQHFGSHPSGTWPSGALGIWNTPMSAIPIEAGYWWLEIYDWVASDTGAITSWRMEGDGNPLPQPYCVSGVSGNGCIPSISGSSQPSASLANSCVIAIVNVESQRSGIIFYGLDNHGFTPLPWGSSFLCVKAPTQRTPLQSSGGTTSLCSGQLMLDWNAYVTSHAGALGTPFTAGARVYLQGWYRDPLAYKVSNMSNALEMTVLP